MTEDEADYRRHFLRADARRGVIVILVCTLANVLFLSNDLRLIGQDSTLRVLFAARVADSLVNAAVIWVLLRSSSPRAHDRAVGAFLAGLVSTVLYIGSTRPAGYTGFAVPNLLLVIVAYFVLAGPIWPRTLAALVLSAGSIWLVFRGTADAAQKSMLAVTHGITHLLGMSLVWRFDSVRRDGYFAHLAERRARAELAEKARELELARDRAEASAMAKSDFLAMMSHELRTPMNAVLGLSDVLEGTSLQPAQRGMVRAIRSSARSLFVVLADILDLADTDERRRSADEEPFLVRELLEGVLDIVRPEASDRGLGLELAVAEDTPVSLSGDAPRLRRLLVHLLLNAIAAAEGSPLVLDAGGRPLPGDGYEISFTARGTGVGVTLRLDQVAEGEVPLGPSSVRRTPRADLRVLVVDDNALNREVALAHLGRLGLEADVAASGPEAIAAVQQATYDLILMDLRMPEMDGHEATRRIFAALPEEKRPRVVALTASTLESDREACRAAGMAGFLRKPLHVEELRRALLDAGTAEPGGCPAASEEVAAAAPEEIAAALAATSEGGAGSAPAQVDPPARENRASRQAKLDPAALALLRELESPDSPDFVLTVCRRFVGDSRARLDRLEAALTSGDAEVVEREAHTLKTAAATVGAREMSSACAALEATARRGDLSTIGPAVTALRAELGEVEAALVEAVGRPLD